jgi:predicted Zn-dependent protease
VKKAAKPVRAANHAKASRPKARPAAHARPAPAVVARQKPVPPRPPTPDPGRKAVEVFEKGFRALQQRQYDKAAEILRSLVTSYPDEKELHERARVFLTICERQAAQARPPRTLEERLGVATLALNRGEAGQAIRMLGDLAREHPEHDHVHYLLAIAHGAAGEGSNAIAHLRRAIELRPSNRLLAVQDADLEALRGDPAFHALIDGRR